MLRFKSQIAVQCLLGLGVLLMAVMESVCAQPKLSQEQKANIPITSEIPFVYVSPDGRFIARIQSELLLLSWSGILYTFEGPQISMWEVETGRLMWCKRGSPNYFPYGHFSPDSTKFLCYGAHLSQERHALLPKKDRVDVSSTTSGEELTSPELEENDGLREMLFSPDGQLLIGLLFDYGNRVSSEAVIRSFSKVWDANTGKLLRTIQNRPELTQTRGWELRGGKLVSSIGTEQHNADTKSTVFLWSWPELELLRSIDTDSKEVGSKAISPDGKQVAFALSAKERVSQGVQLWETTRDESTLLTTPDENLHSRVQSLNFTPDGKTLVGSGILDRQDGTIGFICFWDTHTHKLIRSQLLDRQFGVGETRAFIIRLLPDGKSFTMINNDGNVELRRLEDGALVRVFE